MPRASPRLSVLASHLGLPAEPSHSPTPTPHPTAAAATSKLRVAVAGCHRQTTQPLAGHNFSSALAVNPDVEVVGVFDHGAATRAAYVDCWGETWPGLAAFESFDDLMGTEPDIVVIAARQTMHADFVERAVAAGAKGLLVDKPLCTSPEEAGRIAAACRVPGRHCSTLSTAGMNHSHGLVYFGVHPAVSRGVVTVDLAITGRVLPHHICHAVAI